MSMIEQYFKRVEQEEDLKLPPRENLPASAMSAKLKQIIIVMTPKQRDVIYGVGGTTICLAKWTWRHVSYSFIWFSNPKDAE
ncbi:hypothetical protein YC2023_105799 [Brassica napus]